MLRNPRTRGNPRLYFSDHIARAVNSPNKVRNAVKLAGGILKLHYSVLSGPKKAELIKNLIKKVPEASGQISELCNNSGIGVSKGKTTRRLLKKSK